ncbi:MAG: NADH-quinone oxidoreductase subunit NuoN [Rhodospirillaceae bacterium]|jgi:NADH-quinone oxidoreductase subunit N|nr:NADH-quinone oxidoreductase subunit NuoN [Rhodospirillaceae bacterium]MBT5244750.1 NADH-quinone oxidoreductase subunit NuoN [Rhodospirillaceae bacterium]MBT5562491.1 NADH-quinone oxidoreductase subunit NuoN [Rhodospirillaceae bacterium]MBT6242129.1 NADH-quinone oxidoreductase subunit NuoN [Rhodospirillaceae bacterium]MBT7138980.1 NADH-quinone oxidoreductase subunit NuoN [Rhodospirillaceae bacterium]
MNEIPNMVPALPEIFVAVIGMALLMLGVFQKAGDAAAEVKTARLVSRLGMITLVLAMMLVATVAGSTFNTFSGMFVSDPFAVYFKVLVLFASALTLAISHNYMENQGIARFEYTVLIVFATLGMMIMISANNLMSLYLGLEMQSLSLYVIATFNRDDERSTEAGLKYFVLGAVASGMLLYGSSLVYGFSGTTDFQILGNMFATEHGPDASIGMIVGIVFILAGLSFKVSAVPFHMWTPDVYEGAPTPVTAFFSVGPKIAAIALFIRVMVGPFGDLVQHWQQIIVLISVASMLLGAFAAINQTNIKRMMAYSSIGHVGYALIGLVVANEAGVRGIMIYMAVYLFMNMGAFACILTMRRAGRMVENISDLSGLSKTHPMVAAALAIFMFSMAGIPPLAGFFSKLYIFFAAVESGFFALAIIGVMSSVVGAFYYLRIIKVVYFDPPDESLDTPIDRNLGYVIFGTAMIVVLFFAFPGIIIDGASAAAAALFAK